MNRHKPAIAFGVIVATSMIAIVIMEQPKSPSRFPSDEAVERLSVQSRIQSIPKIEVEKSTRPTANLADSRSEVANQPPLSHFNHSPVNAADYLRLNTEWTRELELASDDKRELIMNLLSFHATFSERARLKVALGRHGRHIEQLWRHGFPGAEVLFLSRSEDEGTLEYRRWLDDVFTDTAATELVDGIQLVLHQGDQILYRLKHDNQFRSYFRPIIWPRFLQLISTSQWPIEVFLESPGTWDLLAEPDGLGLAKEFGVLAVECLESEPTFPVALRPVVVRLLKYRNPEILDYLCSKETRRNRKVHTFLMHAATLNDQQMAMAVVSVARSGTSSASLLSKYTELHSRGQLANEFTGVFDIDTYDDSLPSYIKILTRSASLNNLDEGDLTRAGADAFSDLVTILSELDLPYDADDFVEAIGTPLAGAAQGYKEAMTAQIEQKKMLVNSLTGTSSSKLTSHQIAERSLRLASAFAENAILLRLSEIANNPSAGDRYRAMVSLEFFHSRTDLTPTADLIIREVNAGNLHLLSDVSGAVLIASSPSEVTQGSKEHMRATWLQNLEKIILRPSADSKEN